MRFKDGTEDIIYKDMTTREALHANLDVLIDKIANGSPGADCILSRTSGIDGGDMKPLRITLCFWEEEHRCPKCMGTGSYESTDDAKGETKNETNDTNDSNIPPAADHSM